MPKFKRTFTWAQSQRALTLSRASFRNSEFPKSADPHGVMGVAGIPQSWGGLTAASGSFLSPSSLIVANASDETVMFQQKAPGVQDIRCFFVFGLCTSVASSSCWIFLRVNHYSCWVSSMLKLLFMLNFPHVAYTPAPPDTFDKRIMPTHSMKSGWGQKCQKQTMWTNLAKFKRSNSQRLWTT